MDCIIFFIKAEIFKNGLVILKPFLMVVQWALDTINLSGGGGARKFSGREGVVNTFLCNFLDLLPNVKEN